MLNMIIIDESEKATKKLERFFQEKFIVSFIKPDLLDETITNNASGPNIVLYVNMGAPALAAEKVRQIREAWPKTIVLMVIPTLSSEEQLGGVTILAHTTLFKPCSKSRIVNLVDNYCSLMDDSDIVAQENALLSALVEFAGELRPSLYVAYNRLMPLIMNVCNAAGVDWRQVQKAFMLYILLLSKLDSSILEAMAHGGGRRAKILHELAAPLKKMADILGMNPSTTALAFDLKYVLKRFDGQGLPKDDVKGADLPMASRIIRMLLDYHYLLQNGKSSGQAIYILHQRKGWYDIELFHALVHVLGEEASRGVREVYPLGLLAGMEIAEDVFGIVDGKRKKIIAQNEILTQKTVDYLQRYCENILDITEPIMIVEELFAAAGDSNV